MEDEANEPDNQELDPEARELSDRRDFLRSLGKWSTAAIAAILLMGSSSSDQANGGAAALNSRTDLINGGGDAWINRGGGGWLNSRGGGGSWVNRRG